MLIAETPHGFVCANAGVDSSNIADGAAALLPEHGHSLQATAIAIADELASAPELVMGKISAIPVALTKGARYEQGTGRPVSSFGRSIKISSAKLLSHH